MKTYHILFFAGALIAAPLLITMLGIDLVMMDAPRVHRWAKPLTELGKTFNDGADPGWLTLRRLALIQENLK